MSQQASKTFSKATVVGSLFQVSKKHSRSKYQTPFEFNMQELNPYPEGEWMKLKTIEELTEPEEERRRKVWNKEEEEDKDSLESADEKEREEGREIKGQKYTRGQILRGPLWNYGIRKISLDKDYYNNVLFGIPCASVATPEDMILKGAKWEPKKSITASMVLFVMRKIRKMGYEKTALVELETGRSLSYGELADKAESLACGLHWLGLQQNQILAIVSYNSLEAHLMLLACLLLGAVAALVDSSLNAVDLGIVLRIANPNLIFTESGKTLYKVEAAVNYLEMTLHSRKPRIIINSTAMPDSIHYLLFHTLFKEVDPRDDPPPGPRRADPLRPVMILFTGGPDNYKACLIPERYFTHSMAFVESVFPSTEEPTITLIVTPPMYLALAIKSVFNHYIDGYRIIICRGEIPEPCFITALRKFEVFAVLTLRSLLMDLLEWPARPRCPHLKLVGVTGVPLRLKNLQRVHHELFKDKVQILQLYGLVETGTTAANTFFENKHGSVGKPFYNVEFKVLEEGTGVPLEANQEGELCVRSPTIMLGYYNNPEANKEVFDSEGFIHTGDLGYYDEQGFVHVTSQVRETIKWRSYLISPPLVEEALIELPEVKEAFVFGLFDKEDGELVSAAIILEVGFEETDVLLLEKQANAILPAHRRIRGGIYVFNQFPRSSTGKPIKEYVVKEVMEQRQTSRRKSSLF